MKIQEDSSSTKGEKKQWFVQALEWREAVQHSPESNSKRLEQVPAGAWLHVRHLVGMATLLPLWAQQKAEN